MEVDKEIHESHKITPIEWACRGDAIKQEIGSLNNSVSKLEAALSKRLQPLLEAFSDANTAWNKLCLQEKSSFDETATNEAIRNVVCPGFSDFFTGYLQYLLKNPFVTGFGNELPVLCTEGSSTHVQIPVGFAIESHEVVGESKVCLKFCIEREKNRFLEGLNTFSSVEYRTEEEGGKEGWNSFVGGKTIIENFEFGKTYLFRTKFAVKDNLSSYAYSNVVSFKYNKQQQQQQQQENTETATEKDVNKEKEEEEEEKTENKEEKEEEKEETAAAEETAGGGDNGDNQDYEYNVFDSDDDDESEEKTAGKMSGAEYIDISYMVNGVRYYQGKFKEGRGYTLNEDSTIMTLGSAGSGWKNPTICTEPLVPGVRNRWFFRFRKSGAIWVSVGVTSRPNQFEDDDDDGRARETFWGYSFHNNKVVLGQAYNFDSIDTLEKPKSLDTSSSVFGLELDLRSEGDAILYISFWDNPEAYKMLISGIDLRGKKVYPVISPYNVDDSFELIGDAAQLPEPFNEKNVSYSEITGVRAIHNYYNSDDDDDVDDNDYDYEDGGGSSDEDPSILASEESNEGSLTLGRLKELKRLLGTMNGLLSSKGDIREGENDDSNDGMDEENGEDDNGYHYEDEGEYDGYGSDGGCS